MSNVILGMYVVVSLVPLLACAQTENKEEGLCGKLEAECEWKSSEREVACKFPRSAYSTEPRVETLGKKLC
jgi:hypothetical protein